mgnify:CR=1 FL=1
MSISLNKLVFGTLMAIAFYQLIGLGLADDLIQAIIYDLPVNAANIAFANSLEANVTIIGLIVSVWLVGPMVFALFKGGISRFFYLFLVALFWTITLSAAFFWIIVQFT